MNFKKFDDKAKSLIKEYSSGSGYSGSDYSYYAFLSWFDDIEYAEGDRAFYLRAFFNGELRYWLPLVKTGKTLKDAIGDLPAFSTLCFVTEKIKDELSDEYVSCTNRAWSEYIYRASDFISLQGKRYRAKRNHISKFTSTYSYEMAPLRAEDEQALEQFEADWLASRSFDEKSEQSAVKESVIVREWFAAALRGELICDVLRVDGKIAGVSVGEIMPSGNAVVMYEKADIAYDGIYSFLAHEFAARNLSGCEFINRQEDMGLEGLRKSKLSYYPEFLLDKYLLTPKSLCRTSEEGELIKPCEGDSSLEINPQSESDSTDESAEKVIDINASQIVSEVGSVVKHREIENLTAKAAEIKKAPLESYSFRQLKNADFNAAMTFFKCGISRLENKLFFMNYTDEELYEVLESGYFLGAFYDGHLVATCALDSDSVFGSKLAAICGDESGRLFYEFSGIMVCPYHRGKGLANLICSKVIEHARRTLKNATLCAVVQFDNVASLKNLSKLGFKERARAKYNQYDFKYLTLDIN